MFLLGEEIYLLFFILHRKKSKTCFRTLEVHFIAFAETLIEKYCLSPKVTLEVGPKQDFSTCQKHFH